MTIEAAAGKNPVNHVGKLYNIAAARIAEAIARTCRDVDAAACALVSQIGRSVDDPQFVDVALATGAPVESLEAQVADVVRTQLTTFGAIREDLLLGRTHI